MRNLIKRLLCRHSDGTTFVRNIYGDEINTTGGKRSEWRCKRCDGLVLMDHLNSDAPQRRQAQAQGVPVESIRPAAPAPAMDDVWTNPLNPLSPLSPLGALYSASAPAECRSDGSQADYGGSSTSCDSGSSYSSSDSDSGSCSSSSSD